jgi:hypothetical protein
MTTTQHGGGTDKEMHFLERNEEKMQGKERRWSLKLK